MPNINFNFYTQTGTETPTARPFNFGNVSNTGGTTTQKVYVTHDYTGALRNVGLFLSPYTDRGYVGIYGESEDYNRVLSWGTNSGKGILVNMHTASNTAYDKTFSYDGSTGTGYSYITAMTLNTLCFVSGVSTAPGHFPANGTAQLLFKIAVPPGETSLGQGMFSVKIFYEV